MKQFSVWLFVILVMACTGSFAQSSSENLTYKDELRPGLRLPLMYKTNIAEQTILTKLKETGYKPQVRGNIFNKKNKQDGYYVFNGVQIPELANQQLDLYFKVDPMDGDSGMNSSISLLVSKGYDNFVSPDVDSATFAAAQGFLNSFVGRTASFQVNKLLEDQKKMLEESEGKWKSVRNKQDETRGRISQLESDLKNMEKEEQILQQEVDKHRSAIKELEVKRSAATS